MLTDTPRPSVGSGIASRSAHSRPSVSNGIRCPAARSAKGLCRGSLSRVTQAEASVRSAAKSESLESEQFARGRGVLASPVVPPPMPAPRIPRANAI